MACNTVGPIIFGVACGFVLAVVAWMSMEGSFTYEKRIARRWKRRVRRQAAPYIRAGVEPRAALQRAENELTGVSNDILGDNDIVGVRRVWQ